MRVRIEGFHLPGRQFVSDGAQLTNVHVAVQERRHPVGLVAGDAASAAWEIEVRVIHGDDGRVDFRGPAVQGRGGDRFVYLTWGEVGDDGSFAMFRRAKVMLDRIDPATVRAADAGHRVLVARVDLTDDHGCPRCARVDPPAVTWST
ncbi:MAG: DUF5990 family protein [Acidimicrobiales bacterium]